MRDMKINTFVYCLQHLAAFKSQNLSRFLSCQISYNPSYTIVTQIVRSKLHTSVHTHKYKKMQCAFCMLKTVQKLSVQHWPVHAFNERHIGEVAEVARQR